MRRCENIKKIFNEIFILHMIIDFFHLNIRLHKAMIVFHLRILLFTQEEPPTIEASYCVRDRGRLGKLDVSRGTQNGL